MIIDVREFPEYATGHIAEAKSIPLGSLLKQSQAWPRTQPLTLVCKSGRRAEQARQQLQAEGFTSLQVLPGGMDAWRSQGRPTVVSERRPWAIERQVRVVAGSLVAVTVALGFFVSPLFLAATALVGIGLVFAGVSDTCMMGSLLGRMPWNRVVRSGR